MDLLPGTAAAWLETLTNNRVWDEFRDAPRIRKAFVTLAGSRSTWPAPKDLVDALPASEQKQLPRSTGIPATKEEREANLERLRQLHGDVIRQID